MTSVSPKRTKLFISYSHADKEWLERLKRHLKPSIRNGNLDLWEDTRIRSGDEWREEIRSALESACVAVLLISADFFASDFIVSDELPPLLNRVQFETRSTNLPRSLKGRRSELESTGFKLDAV